jgi:flagellar motor switch protein FliM
MEGNDDLERITPEEMEALAEVLQSPSNASGFGADEDEVVLKYDLVGASGSPRHSMPVLDLVHDRFCQSLKYQLTRATRIEGEIERIRPIHMKCAEVYSSLESPCTVVAIDAQGLDTTGMLIFDPLVMMHLLDLCIGGTGAEVKAIDTLRERGFSKTEERLAHHLIRFFGRAITKAWEEVSEVHVEALRIESNPRHAVILDPSSPVMVFPVKLDWKGIVGEVRFVLPLSCLRPIENQLASTVVGVKREMSSPWESLMLQHVEDTQVELIVELGRSQMTLRQLLDLKAGELVRLDKEPGGALEVRVSGEPKYHARPVVHHGNMAIEVLGVLSPDEE